MPENETPALLHPIPAACQRIGIGRGKLYGLIREGKIKPVKLGTRTLIPERELVRFTDELIQGAAHEAA